MNSYYFYNADRVRHQANASLTKFASGFAGEHNLKFGAEFERSYVKSEYGYPGGMYMFANFGVPYYAYLWDGYLKDNVNNRFTVVRAGLAGRRVRGSRSTRASASTASRGYNKHLDEQVFTTNSFSPRIGFAWDVTGNGKTVVRGHYGLYFDGAKSCYYDLLDPQISAVYGAYIDEQPERHQRRPYLTTPGTNRTMDDDIKHPRMKQAIVGVERELVPGLSLGVTGIWRENDQFIDDVLQTA